MEVYRIVREKYAYNLTASANRNRWNGDGQFVLYTSQSRALACIENLVHRSNRGANHVFKTMIISVPDNLSVLSIHPDELPKNWKKVYCEECLLLGQKWYIKNKHLILKVPSSIISNEWNYILNTEHHNFKKIELLATEEFLFDDRL